MNGMIGCSRASHPDITSRRVPEAAARLASPRSPSSRPFTSSRYQSQKSPHTNPCAASAASWKRNSARAASTRSTVSRKRERIQRSASSGSGPAPPEDPTPFPPLGSPTYGRANRAAFQILLAKFRPGRKADSRSS